MTTAGKSFIYNDMYGTWLRLTDSGSSVQAISNFSTASATLPLETRGHSLSSLSYLTTSTAPKIPGITDELRLSASVMHCQDQVFPGFQRSLDSYFVLKKVTLWPGIFS